VKGGIKAMHSSTNSKSIYFHRQANLTTAMIASGLEAIILNTSPSLFYLTGLQFHLSERPVLAVFTPHEPLIIVLPELEAGKVNMLPFPFQAFPYGEDPSSWGGILRQGLKAAKIERGLVGIEPRRLRYLELSLLQEAAPNLDYTSAESVIASLRMYKDEGEIEAMQKAVDIAQQAIQAAIPTIAVGISEREIASNLVLELIHAGTDFELPFSPIVSGGPNSANPHATPSSRVLSPGDLLVVDWGASFNGYFSDITRTFAMGEIDPQYHEIANIVQEANEAARSAVRPGIPAEKVDMAAREVIEGAGFGKFFIHRTGHGLGLEGHEEPYIRAENQLLLDEGMTFTIEPGIYLPGRAGVRIEDNVYVTKDGCESLTHMPRELLHIP
jgi:Xaa-Pro dipeptidase